MCYIAEVEYVVPGLVRMIWEVDHYVLLRFPCTAVVQVCTGCGCVVGKFIQVVVVNSSI